MNFVILIPILLTYITSSQANVLLETNPKIVNGSDASKGQFPFTVSFQLNGEHHCGGSIISTQYILTAGHCCDVSVISSQIKAGIVDLNDAGLVISVDKITIHPEFVSDNLVNDLCILKLKEPLELSELVQIIQLDTVNEDITENCTVLGWGTLEYLGESPNTLQYLDGTTVMYNECTDLWAHVIHFPIYQTHVCAFPRDGEGACHGDSGGPLFTYDDVSGVVKQTGVMSWGNPCANNFPDVFVKIASYKDWIDSIISN